MLVVENVSTDSKDKEHANLQVGSHFNDCLVRVNYLFHHLSRHVFL